MRKILFSILLGVMILGVSVGNGMAQTPPAIDVNLVMNKTNYLLNSEPVTIDITLNNTGEDDIITSEGFRDEPFHLFLTFIDPDGNGITAGEVGSGEGVNPPVIPVVTAGVVQMVQVEPVEILAGNGVFNLPVPSFDATTIYNLNKTGNYSVKVVIPIRTYQTILDDDSDGVSNATDACPGTPAGQTVDVNGCSSGQVASDPPGVDYSELSDVLFEGVIESNTVIFSMTGDADGDGDPNTTDCDDNDPARSSLLTEIPDNGIDDDCNPATSDVVAIDTGTINVQVDRHTVGSGSHPVSTKEPIDGMVVRAYDKTNECVSYFGVSWQYYESNWRSSCGFSAEGVTGVGGTVDLAVLPGNYLVIGEYDTDGTGPEDPIYIGVSAGGVASGETKSKYLQVIEKANGKKVPAKYTKKTGSELLIIEPEYVEWDGTQELYPFVFDSLGDWTVTTSVSPPEGFVADNDSLTEEVNTELEAVQFTITDIGSDWVDTGVTHDLNHKGKKEKIKSKIGVKLSRKLAKKKGLNRFGKKKEKKEKK